MRTFLAAYKWEIVLFSLIFLLGIFLRFYRLEAYIHFLGDEGRDMRIVRAIYTEGDIPFLGPNASVGGFFLGPIYYWMIAPFLFLAQSNPVGPAIMVALLGSVTLGFIYVAGRRLGGIVGALSAMMLYAVAPIVVRYSRFSWNPNPVPLFSLLAVGGVFLAITSKRRWWYVIAGLAMGVNVQLHYLTTILFPVLGLSILLTERMRRWWIAAAMVLGGFLLSYAPFLLFEVKNNFPNHRTIFEFVTRKDSAVHFEPGWILRSIHNVGDGLYRVLFPLPFPYAAAVLFWASAIVLLGLTLGAIVRRTPQRPIFLILSIWFFGGILGLSAYQGGIYDYYYGFLYPVPFLIFASVAGFLWASPKQRVARLIVRAGIIGVTLFLAVVIAEKLYIWQGPQYIPQQTRDIAQFVLEQTEGRPYNFALIAERNSDDAYRYYLELAGRPPIDIENPVNDPERVTVTDQLLVVCEDAECEPLGHPKWEIAGFGQAEIVGQWYMVGGITVQKLVHFPDDVVD